MIMNLGFAVMADIFVEIEWTSSPTHMQSREERQRETC